MASRALTARFIRTCSIWPGSAFTVPRSGRQAGRQLDVLADQAAQHLVHVLDDAVEVEHLRGQHLPAAEGQQLPRQGGGALGRLADLVHGLAGRILRPRMPFSSSSL